MVIVELCMGSACFALGNNKSVEGLRQFVESEHLSGHILVRGAFCEGLCGKGPVVKVNGKPHYNQSLETLVAMLRQMVEGV